MYNKNISLILNNYYSLLLIEFFIFESISHPGTSNGCLQLLQYFPLLLLAYFYFPWSLLCNNCIRQTVVKYFFDEAKADSIVSSHPRSSTIFDLYSHCCPICFKEQKDFESVFSWVEPMEKFLTKDVILSIWHHFKCQACFEAFFESSK